MHVGTISYWLFVDDYIDMQFGKSSFSNIELYITGEALGDAHEKMVAKLGLEVDYNNFDWDQFEEKVMIKLRPYQEDAVAHYKQHSPEYKWIDKCLEISKECDRLSRINDERTERLKHETGQKQQWE